MAQTTHAVAIIIKNSSLPMERMYRLRLYPSRASPLSFVLLGSASTAQSFDASAKGVLAQGDKKFLMQLIASSALSRQILLFAVSSLNNSR